MSKLKEYEKSITKPLRQATILLLIRGDEVLLAMKKRGFGVGKWNGVGGKSNPGEDVMNAAVREAEEEINVKATDLIQVAELNFYFPLVPIDKNWNQQVLVYKTDKWTGEPTETEEMKPQWFKISEIPYIEMWPDDVLWMPKVFGGSFVRASFMFDENQEISEHYFLLQ
ncbi:8-oxo-dGTP diphosphatase [Candidatus Collierbacteria bacterium]|nr:8-oxo-dGTP diphosphatase [Candidatus Collierbacteria bacterium]